MPNRTKIVMLTLVLSALALVILGLIFALLYAKQSLANAWWKWPIGYVFAVVVAHWPINLVTVEWWERLAGSKLAEQPRDSTLGQYWTTRGLGCVERALYVASWHVGCPQFIAIWLALKVAGQWKRETMVAVGERKVPAVVHYNRFLVGSALSVAYGSVGGYMIRWTQSSQWPLALLVPGLLLAGTVVLYWTTRLSSQQLGPRPRAGRAGQGAADATISQKSAESTER